jgi:hypothetical protein
MRLLSLYLKPFPVFALLAACAVFTWLLSPQPFFYGPDISSESRRKPSQTSRVALAYSLLGTEPSAHQSYVWDSIEQARFLNPHVPVFVVANKALSARELAWVVDNAKKVDAAIEWYEDLAANSQLAKNFDQYFYVKNDMVPVDGNRDFVRLTIGRVVALALLADKHQLQNLFHLENDNMLYADLDSLLSDMDACHLDVAIPIIDKLQAALSFGFFRTPAALRDLVEYITELYREGPKALESLLGGSVNDMTLLYLYLTGYRRDSIKTSIEPIPNIAIMPTWLVKADEEPQNCLWKQGAKLYDGAATGQYFGGTHSNPSARWYEPQRPFKELNTSNLVWKPCARSNLCTLTPEEERASQGAFCPCIGDSRVLNLHIHSKQLNRFTSKIKHPEM